MQRDRAEDDVVRPYPGGGHVGVGLGSADGGGCAARRFGRPVEPDEYWNTAASSGDGGPARRRALAVQDRANTSTVAAIRTAIARQTSAPSGVGDDRAHPALAEVELELRLLERGLSGTTTAPARSTPRKATAKAGVFGSTSATGSPGADAARGQRPRQMLDALAELRPR